LRNWGELLLKFSFCRSWEGEKFFKSRPEEGGEGRREKGEGTSLSRWRLSVIFIKLRMICSPTRVQIDW